MAENEQKIQLESCVTRLLETINNSSVMKHPLSAHGAHAAEPSAAAINAFIYPTAQA